MLLFPWWPIFQTWFWFGRYNNNIFRHDCFALPYFFIVWKPDNNLCASIFRDSFYDFPGFKESIRAFAENYFSDCELLGNWIARASDMRFLRNVDSGCVMTPILLLSSYFYNMRGFDFHRIKTNIDFVFLEIKSQDIEGSNTVCIPWMISVPI